MGKNIQDVISNANATLVKSHREIANQPTRQDENAAEFLGFNNLGYPIYQIRGRKLLKIGFFATEEQFAVYYEAAKSMIENEMRTPQGDEQVLKTPDVNALAKYSTDFFVGNVNAAKNMKPSDLRKIGMQLIKQLPKMMK
jgi:hypothetical protein